MRISEKLKNYFRTIKIIVGDSTCNADAESIPLLQQHIHAWERAVPMSALHASPYYKARRRHIATPAGASVPCATAERAATNIVHLLRHDGSFNKAQYFLHTKAFKLKSPPTPRSIPLLQVCIYSWSFEPDRGSIIDMPTQKKISLLLLRNLRGAQQ